MQILKSYKLLLWSMIGEMKLHCGPDTKKMAVKRSVLGWENGKLQKRYVKSF